MNTEDLQRFLTEAQSTLNPVEAGQKLRLVVKEARNIVQSNGGFSEAWRIIFQARSLIIREEVNWEKRAAGWTRMVEELSTLAADNNDADFADMLCQVVTDAIQDIADVRRHAEFFGWMSTSLRLVDKVIAAKSASARSTSILLARKASVLRHRAQLQETRKLARNDAEAAERTAVRARDLDTSVETHIEFALSSWTLARFQQIEAKYRSILTDCETALTSQICKDDVAAMLTLARLFRLTFRHELAIKTFERALATKQRPRLVLRQSYIYAEAALGLASQASPNFEDYLHSANELLEKASASSLLTLRNRVALAHVKSILFGQAEMDAIVDQLTALRNQTASEAIHNWHDVRRVGCLTSALMGPNEVIC